jgi:hypothetical protein
MTLKQVGNIVAMAGLLAFVYSFLGRFIGGPTIGLGIIKAEASSGMAAANSVMLIAILMKLI